MRPASLIPAAIFLILAGLFYLAVLRGDPSRVPSALIGKPVPEFDLQPLAGIDTPSLRSEDFRKGKRVVLNVFASWCVPCRAEHPLLTDLKRLSGAPLYGLNYKDDAKAAGRFLAELGNPFDRIGADRSGAAAIDWGVYGVPETYIVGGDGRILYKHVGPLTEDVIKNEMLPVLKDARS